MPFQTQVSTSICSPVSVHRSSFQGLLCRLGPKQAPRAARHQVQTQALGLLESAPIIVEAMKIGFASAAVPGAIKGLWDVRRAKVEPHPDKPLTQARQSVMICNQATLFGASGTLMGLSAGVYATQLGFAPEAAWQAGTVTGLVLSAVAWGLFQQKQAATPKPEDEDKRSGSPLDACDEKLCDLPESWDDITVPSDDVASSSESDDGVEN